MSLPLRIKFKNDNFCLVQLYSLLIKNLKQSKIKLRFGWWMLIFLLDANM